MQYHFSIHMLNIVQGQGIRKVCIFYGILTSLLRQRLSDLLLGNYTIRPSLIWVAGKMGLGWLQDWWLPYFHRSHLIGLCIGCASPLPWAWILRWSDSCGFSLHCLSFQVLNCHLDSFLALFLWLGIRNMEILDPESKMNIGYGWCHVYAIANNCITQLFPHAWNK